MGTMCCNHMPSLYWKESFGYAYRCSSCGLEGQAATTADGARSFWELISKTCTPIDATIMQWRERRNATRSIASG